MKHIAWGLLGLGLWASGTAALAQDRIYRCGNEYTNNAAMARQNNCRLIEGAAVTVVSTPAGAGKSSSAAPASASGAAPAAASSGSGGARVSAQQQQVRDNDARAILQAERDKAQSKLNALQAEYNDGNPVKTALELRNPQGFIERVEALKTQIARQQSDLAGIDRELSRLPGATAP